MAYHPFRHLGLKFLSIALAVVLWLSVADQGAVERAVRAALEFHNLPSGLVLVDNPPDSVEVRLRGPSGALGRLPAGEVIAVLDLRTARAGTRLFHLAADGVRVPFGVEVSQVTPAAVSLTFEASASKEVPVVPAVDGDPPAGYNVGRISADPPLVVVIGPRSRIDTLKSATTEPISVARATSTVVDRVSVGVTDDALRLERPQTAMVTVEIVAASTERRVSGVSVTVRNRSTRRTVDVTPASVDLVIRGAAAAVEAAPAPAVFVDVAGLAAGHFQLPVRAELGSGLELVRAEPASVQVRIR
jgi:YbbR domain-containing protein